MISKCTQQDYQAACDLLRKSWVSTYVDGKNGLSEIVVLEALKNIDKQKISPNLYILKENNRLKGLINFSNNEIHMLYVHPDFVGQGYGSVLLNYALERLESPIVRVAKNNNKAINFYLKKGFVKTDEESIFVLDDDNYLINQKLVYKKVDK